MLHIVTGPRGIGKTTALLSFINRLILSGIHPEGILTPAIKDDLGRKCGFSAKNIANNDLWELARTDRALKGPVHGPFSFSSKGFEKALSIIEESLKQNRNIFFLDEIGPLELKRKAGFYPILPELDKAALTGEIFVVIRPELINLFKSDYVHESPCRIISVSLRNRENPDLFNTIE
ncbi:MAG: hypothetical protein JXR86_09385 [Spirochaetales bacterium]|nr:hypothetical protein [Spirochaetales bacterium]